MTTPTALSPRPIDPIWDDFYAWSLAVAAEIAAKYGINVNIVRTVRVSYFSDYQIDAVIPLWSATWTLSLMSFQQFGTQGIERFADILLSWMKPADQPFPAPISGAPAAPAPAAPADPVGPAFAGGTKFANLDRANAYKVGDIFSRADGSAFVKKGALLGVWVECWWEPAANPGAAPGLVGNPAVPLTGLVQDSAAEGK